MNVIAFYVPEEDSYRVSVKLTIPEYERYLNNEAELASKIHQEITRKIDQLRKVKFI